MNVSARQRHFLSICLLLLLLMTAFAAYQPGLAANVSPTPPGTPVTQQDIMRVAATMYCPLCVGERLDVCEIPLCREMKVIIGEKLAAGETPAQIRAYFVNQYGPVVLGEPPQKGIHLITWLLPAAALLLIGIWLFLRLRKETNTPATETAASLITNAETDGEAEDPYLQQVEKDTESW